MTEGEVKAVLWTIWLTVMVGGPSLAVFSLWFSPDHTGSDDPPELDSDDER